MSGPIFFALAGTRYQEFPKWLERERVRLPGGFPLRLTRETVHDPNGIAVWATRNALEAARLRTPDEVMPSYKLGMVPAKAKVPKNYARVMTEVLARKVPLAVTVQQHAGLTIVVEVNGPPSVDLPAVVAASPDNVPEVKRG